MPAQYPTRVMSFKPIWQPGSPNPLASGSLSVSSVSSVVQIRYRLGGRGAGGVAVAPSSGHACLG